MSTNKPYASCLPWKLKCDIFGIKFFFSKFQIKFKFALNLKIFLYIDLVVLKRPPISLKEKNELINAKVGLGL